MYGLPMTLGLVPNLGSEVVTLEHAVAVLGAVSLAITLGLFAALLSRATRRSPSRVVTEVAARDVKLLQAA